MNEKIIIATIQTVAAAFSMPGSEVYEQTKRRKNVDARHLIYYLCAKKGITFTEIAEHFNLNGFSSPRQSIAHGARVIERKVDEDRDYKILIKQLQHDITRRLQ